MQNTQTQFFLGSFVVCTLNYYLMALIFVFFMRMQWLFFIGEQHTSSQKYSRLRCLLRVKGLGICFYLSWSGSILQFRQNMIKVGSKSWLLTCSSNITLSLPSYTSSALKRDLNFCNGYLGLLYFCQQSYILNEQCGTYRGESITRYFI